MKVIDPNGPEWLSLKRQVIERLDSLRKEIEGSGVDYGQTQFLRGQIAAFRVVLKAETVEEQTRVKSPGYLKK